MAEEKKLSVEDTEVTSIKEEAAPVKVSSKHIKKAERREAKAARKAANRIEEKKARPNNGLIALLIFGVVIAMFAFVLGYNYFSKPATIAQYIEDNGGEEVYGSMQIDGYTTAAITADGNSMNIAMNVETDDEELISQATEYYKGDDGLDQIKYLAAYFLTSMKPETRAFSADVKAQVTLGDDELNSVEMTYKEAKDYLEELQKEAEVDAEEAAEDESDADADDVSDEADVAGEASGDDASGNDE